MLAGTYYVGDLCYVMHPEWDEFCDITMANWAQFKGERVIDGEFALKDGRQFATYVTLYGDGMYCSNIGTEHSVDAGLIGCIRIEDIRDPVATVAHMKGLGAIITFDQPFETSESDGVIRFGHVEINTGDLENDCYGKYDE